MWPTGGIGESLFRGYAQRVIYCRDQVLRRDRVLRRVGGLLVAAAIHVTAAEPATRQNAREAAGPVIAAIDACARVAIPLADAGSAPEHTGPDHQRLVEHSALAQV